MKTLIFATILTTLPAFAAEAPPSAEEASPLPATQAAYAALEDALGAGNVQTLSDRGVLLLSGSKKSRGVLHVQWPLLEQLAAGAEDFSVFAGLYVKARAGKEIDGDASALRRIEKMKDAGPLTSAVRAAAAILASQLENIGPPPEAKPLPATPWGRAFWARTHADLVSDYRPAAHLFFSTLLYGPFKDDQAEAHFLAAQPVAVESLQRDQRAGEASPQTLSAIAAYLTEQKRLWDVSQTRSRLAALERSTNLSRDAKDLSALAERLSSGPDALRALRFALKSKGPAPVARFSGADLHVNLASGSEPYDVGDEAVVSLAYWVEGLSAKDSIEVTEAGFLDEGEAGLSALKTSVLKRSAGGPHTLRYTVPLRSSGRKVFRFLLEAADGASASREAVIEVSPRFDEVVSAAADAESDAQACRLEEAETGFSDLEKSLREADKPQFRSLLSWLKPRIKRAAEQAAQAKTLGELMDGVRLHASKERCDFKSEKARRALALLDGLPPGCDRLSAPQEGAAAGLRAELETLLRQTELRRANQDAFRASAETARKQEAACRHEEAAEAYASALALLDSDGEARCGPWESDYTAIRLQDLPRARAGKAISDDVEAKLVEAQSADHAGALAILTPLIARIDSLESRSCYQALRKKAEELASAAGLALGPGEAAEGTPSKDDTDEAIRAVSSERERLDRIEAERRERERLSQEPSIRSGREPAATPEKGGQP
ncbi:MAG TPA: hypothetical protein DCM05_08665 [Elusimicrobia bacterium]|nr:hypothetical protein [Elusimicrobiota bacterium]